jgi:hypothetical protein
MVRALAANGGPDTTGVSSGAPARRRPEGAGMYGTIARLKISRDNLAKLEALQGEQMGRNVAGFKAAHVLVPDERDDEAYLVVFFDDKASYQKNADDPAQHEDYLKMRALLDADPEWIDGEWRSS